LLILVSELHQKPAGHTCQTGFGCRSMISSRLHDFSSFFCYVGCGELPNLWDHTGVGEQLTPSFILGGPRRYEEQLKMGAYIYTFSTRGQYAGDTMARRQPYANCTVNTLINLQPYAKMSMEVAHTSHIRQTYVTHALSTR
jgi:hypothetical protein